MAIDHPSADLADGHISKPGSTAWDLQAVLPVHFSRGLPRDFVAWVERSESHQLRDVFSDRGRSRYNGLQ
jgi:hypothetical protein